MPNGVPPTGSAGSEVWVVIEDVLVDVGENEFTVGRTEDGHRDETDVAMLRFRFLGLQRALLQQLHGQRESRRVRRIAWRNSRRVQTQPFGHGIIVQLETVVVECGGGHSWRVLSEWPRASFGAAAHVVGARSRRTVRRARRRAPSAAGPTRASQSPAR